MIVVVMDQGRYLAALEDLADCWLELDWDGTMLSGTIEFWCF